MTPTNTLREKKKPRKWSNLSQMRKYFIGFRRSDEGIVFRNNLYELQKGKCSTCGRIMQVPSETNQSNRDIATLDHIQELNKGGSNKISNLRLICKRCNDKKNMQSQEISPIGIQLRKLLTLNT